MEIKKLTPSMWSNIDPAPYVASASSEFSSEYRAYKAFNGTYDSSEDGWLCQTDSISKEEYIQIFTGNKVKVHSFSIRSRNGSPVFHPVKFKLLVSNDGTAWEEVFITETAQAFSSNEVKEYTLDSPYECKYVRLTITEHYPLTAGAIRTFISEFEIFGEEMGDDRLSINKTLKANLPDFVQNGKDELHFTEDGGIYINDKDGHLVQCNTGNIVMDVSNPLTINPVERLFSANTILDGIVINEPLPLGVRDGNMFVENDKILFKAGKTYNIMLMGNAVFSQQQSQADLAIFNDKTKEVVDGSKINLIPTTAIYTHSIHSPISNITVTFEEDTYCYVGVSYQVKLNSVMFKLVVEEMITNPVNQYGGFETEVLFDGNANNIEEYLLTNDVNNFDFIIPTYKVKGDYDSIPSAIPKMTSNTEPSPYVAKASSETCPAFGAFNQVTGGREQVWYSETGFPHWLSITNNQSPMTINAFEITNGTEPSGYSRFAPKTFTFEGSNDGETYDVIKEFTIPNLATGEKIMLFLDKAVSYKSYKLNITDGYYVDNHAGVVIGELKLLYVKETIDSSIIPVSSMGSIIKKVVSNENMSILFNDDKLEVLSSNGMSISKVIGIKGQLPSLLVGGEF